MPTRAVIQIVSGLSLITLALCLEQIAKGLEWIERNRANVAALKSLPRCSVAPIVGLVVGVQWAMALTTGSTKPSRLRPSAVAAAGSL
jgi:hypothetical protein